MEYLPVKFISNLKLKIYPIISDMLYSQLKGMEWAVPPRYVCEKLVMILNIVKSGQSEIEGRKYVNLTTYSGITFYGPIDQKHWNCHPKKIIFLKKRLNQSSVGTTMTDAHYALIYNLIVRYIMEFSPYPFQPYRTHNLIAGDIFIDIGSFRGYVALKAALKVGQTGVVYAIEPVEENAKFIRLHSENNNLTNIKVIEGTVTTSNTEREVKFYITENQANSCMPDHITSNPNVLFKNNVSTEYLAKLSDRSSNSQSRVIASITTNGDEMDIAESMICEFEKTSIKYIEITLPIIYTRERVPSFISNCENKNCKIEYYYPWVKIIKSM